MGIKDFFAKKALALQLKKLPKEQREIIESLLESDPELFEKMGKEIKTLTKQGKGQMEAMMIVMKKYQSRMQQLLMKNLSSKQRPR